MLVRRVVTELCQRELRFSPFVMLVWSFDIGGAGLVAVHGGSTTIPGVVASPMLTGVTARVRGDRLLRVPFAARTVVLAPAVVAMALHGPSALVIALVAASAALSGTRRLPHHDGAARRVI